MGRLRDEYASRLACPNLRFITSLPRRPNPPTITPRRMKEPVTMTARSPPGSSDLNRGSRNDPMKTMTKISTGKRANERFPNIVEWSLHSSFSMLVKSSNIRIPR